MTQFIIKPVYNKNSRIVGYQARAINAAGYYVTDIAPREVFATSKEALLEAEAAGWQIDESEGPIAVLSDSGDGGLLTARDIALRG